MTGAFEGGARRTLRLNAGTCSTSAMIDMLCVRSLFLDVTFVFVTHDTYISVRRYMYEFQANTVIHQLVSCNKIQTSHSTIRALA